MINISVNLTEIDSQSLFCFVNECFVCSILPSEVFLMAGCIYSVQ